MNIFLKKLGFYFLFINILSMYTNANTCSVLVKAIEENNLQKAQELIKDTSLLECRDDGGMTPLMLTAAIGSDISCKIASQLIEKGANINAKMEISTAVTTRGNTALHVAALNGNDQIVALLITSGAEVNEQNDRGETALMQAALMRNIATAKLLIEKGCKMDLRTKAGDDVLLYAFRSTAKSVDIAHLLLNNGMSVNSRGRMGRTALHWAASYGHYDTVRLLVEKGWNINEVDEQGRSALMQASGSPYPSLEMVKYLLDNSADIHQHDVNGINAYFHALERGNIEIADLLASTGADTIPHNRICKKILKEAKRKGYEAPK